MKVLAVLLSACLPSVLLAPPAHAQNPVELRQLADGVWMHTSYYRYPGGSDYPSNGLLIKEGRGLLLVDTAWGELQTVELLKAIKAKIDLPVSMAMVTHSHGDRAAGIDVLKAHKVKVFAHPLTRAMAVGYGLPVPDAIFDQLTEPGSAVAFGSATVFFPGTAHAKDNLMVWLPEQKILFGGCAVRALSAHSVGNTAHGDTASWLQVMKHIAQRYRSATVVVPGHGEPGGPALVAHTEKLLSSAMR